MLRLTSLGRSLVAQTLCISQRPTCCRLQSTWTQYEASLKAPREVPTPVVILSASKWSREGKADEQLSSFVKHFTTRGWTVSCVDLDPPDLPTNNSESILSTFEAELKSQLKKLDTTPFPPLLIAKDLSTLIAEQYVSSNALSAMVLINPPLTPADACDQNSAESSLHPRLPTLLKPFTYEFTFPSLVVWTKEGASKMAFWDAHRIEHAKEDEADASLDRQTIDLNSEEEVEGAGPNEIRKWAEDCGMLRFRKALQAEERTRLKQPKSQKPVVKPTPDWYQEGYYIRSAIGGSKKEPLIVDRKHVEENFIRGSGPGGQAINKLSTCVQLKHIPTGIVVRSQKTRSQELNRLQARRLLSQELERYLFGDNDSVLGAKAITARKKKLAKVRKRRKRKLLQHEEKEKKEKNNKEEQQEMKES